MRDEKIPSEVIKKIQNIQLRMTFLIGELRQKKIAYTSEEVKLMEKMLSFESQLQEAQKELRKQIDTWGKETLTEVFTSKETMQKDYLITVEMQKSVAKEILGYEITVEDYLEGKG